MKIINKENGTPVAYVQKKNLKAILKYDRDLPRGIVKVIKALGYYEYDEHDEEFVRIEGKKEVKYIATRDWIPDYKQLRDLSDEELQTLVDEETLKLNDIHILYSTMSREDQLVNYHLPAEYAKKNQTIKDINAYLWTRQGKYDLPIEIPLAIDSDEVNIEIDKIGCKIGPSLDKNKIIFTKTNNQPFNEYDAIPMPVVHTAIMVVATETGMITSRKGECCIKSYTDPTGMYFVHEFESIIEKSDEKIQQPEEPVKHQEPTRVEQKAKKKTLFSKIFKSNKKDAE